MTKMHNVGMVRAYMYLLQCEKCKRVHLHRGTTHSIPHCPHCSEGER